MSIEAMKQALEALEATMSTHGFAEYIEEAKEKAITSLRQAIAEAEKQEPVAVVCNKGAKFHHMAKLTDAGKSLPDRTRLYTSPPQRQPLTDEQFLELILRKGPVELLAAATFVPADTKRHGQIALLRSAKIIKEFVESAYGIKETS